MPAQLLSEERIQDSSDGESDSTDPTQTLKETVKKIRSNSSSRPVTTAESEEDSDDSDNGSQASDASSTSSISSAGKRKADDAVTTLTESAAKRAKTSSTPTKRIESTNYAPPHGFASSKFAAHEFSSMTKGVFENLDGKQVWHISAPSSMPMSKLESLDMESALKGVPILSRKGVQYTLQRNALEGQNLLLPKGMTGEYSSSNILPSRSFQICESASKPKNGQSEAENGDDEATNLQFFATKAAEKKLPRKQPQTLNGRYVPYGVTRDEAGEDTNMEGVLQSEQTVHASPRTPKKSKKNRAEDAENEDSTGGSKKKSKSKAIDGAPIVTDSHKKKKKSKTVSSSQ